MDSFLWKTYLFGIWVSSVLSKLWKGDRLRPEVLRERGDVFYYKWNTFELETKNQIKKVLNKLRYSITYYMVKKLPIFSSYLENSFFVYSILVLSKQLPFSCKVGLTFDISCGDPTMHATRWSTKCELCLSNIQSSSLATGRRPIKVSKPILLFYQDFLTDQMSI